MEPQEIQRMQPSDINVSQLEVRIHVVKVDGKKMTQSVFKQLPVTDIVDAEGNEMPGPITPWGIVRHDGVWLLFEFNGALHKSQISTGITEFYREQLAKHEQTLRKYVEQAKGSEVYRSLIALEEKFVDEYKTKLLREQKRVAVYSNYSSLTQLFIAV